MLVLVILGQRLAGIGGALGGALIAWGLSRTIRNPDYSKGKKILYSILYVAGGVVLAVIMAAVLIGVIPGLFGVPLTKADTPSSGETSTQPPVSSSDSASPDTSTTLEGYKYYKNIDLSIKSMPYPESWIVNESLKDYRVVFSSPQKDAWITSTTYAREEKMDLRTYMADLRKAAQEPNEQMKVTILNDKIENINGKDWLFFDATVDYGNVVAYERSAIVVTGLYGGKQSMQIMLETNEAKFSTYSETFNKIINATQVG